MPLSLLLFTLTSAALAAAPCPSEPKVIDRRGSKVFAECYCQAARPEAAVKLAEEFGMSFEGNHVWKHEEKFDGLTYGRCNLTFRYKDPKRNKAPDCKARFAEFKAKLDADKSMPDFASTYSLVMCL